MNEWIVARINSLKEDLSKKQEYFKINIQNMDSPTYEDNTINDLLVMKFIQLCMVTIIAEIIQNQKI